MKYFFILATAFSLNFTSLTNLPISHSENENDLEELLLEHYECASYWDISATQNITVSLETDATSYQKKQLNNSIEEINSLNLGFTYSLIDSGGLISINFVSSETPFFDGVEYVSLDDLQAFGYAIKEGYIQPGSENCFYIDQAEVFVDKDLDEIYTSLTVFHEVLHTTGLNHTSCISSMMYNKEGSPFTVPSFNNLPLDKLALEILYSSNNRLVNHELIKKHLTNNNISIEELCIEQKYEIVLFEGSNYICDVEPTQSPCYATTEFTNNKSAAVDIWCDLNTSECDDYPFRDWDAINFNEKTYYCNLDDLCIEESKFNSSSSKSFDDFDIVCGTEYCTYLNEKDSLGGFNETDSFSRTEFINILLLATFLIITRKIYITKRKSKIQYVEINESSNKEIYDEKEEIYDEFNFD